MVSSPGSQSISSRLVRAGGALVWRRADGGSVGVGEAVGLDALQVLVVHRPKYEDWSWPKGKREGDEPLALTAVREVEEETGEVIELRQPLATQRYRLGTGQTKEVRYWVGRVCPAGAARRTRRPVVRAAKREIDRSLWVPASRALECLTRRGDRRMLEDVLAQASRGELEQRTLVVARHAHAVPRAQWADPDARRPLTRRGSREALDMLEVLSALGVGVAWSSPWLRCRQTLGPYAALAGVPLRTWDHMTEGAVAREPARVRESVEHVLDAVCAVSTPICLCTHRPVLPIVRDALADRAAAAVRRALPEGPAVLCPAGLLIAHIGGVGRRVLAAHSVDPRACAHDAA